MADTGTNIANKSELSKVRNAERAKEFKSQSLEQF